MTGLYDCDMRYRLARKERAMTTCPKDCWGVRVDWPVHAHRGR